VIKIRSNWIKSLDLDQGFEKDIPCAMVEGKSLLLRPYRKCNIKYGVGIEQMTMETKEEAIEESFDQMAN
jgi:hypothetical protein